jgi:hypothetical protein
MSNKNRPLKAGLAAFGLIWTSAHIAEAQVAEPPTPQTTAEPLPAATQVPAPEPSSESTFAVLLLKNGRVMQGNVTTDKTGENYLIELKGGPVPLPKRNVQKRCSSMKELYDYKVATVAKRDPDELMRLAQWCLENQMNPEAKTHLKEILAIYPANTRAERMIVSIDAASERTTKNRDADVQVTSGSMVEKAPRELNKGVVGRARGTMGKAINQPVIFDLPAPTAYKLATEYTQYVHPVLQMNCAGCHNQDHPGDFQLVHPATRREWTPEVVRLNMDATLRYVDRNDPLKSDILAYAANAHGTALKPVFHGPNDARYRTLTTWLGRLKSPDASVDKAAFTTPGNLAPSVVAQAQGEAFGADRSGGRTGPPAASAPPVATTPTSGGFRAHNALNAYEVEGVSPLVPNGTRFEPPVLPGSVPLLPSRAQRPARALPGPIPTIPGVNGPKMPSSATVPPGVFVPPPDDVIPPSNRSKNKKKNVDPAMLEQLLKSRADGTTPPQP